MQAYLTSQKSNCKNCYKCIRHCPVKSIRFSGNQAHIMEDECVLCGQCYTVCPQNAKEIHNDLEKVQVLIGEYPTVVASVAPSFSAFYPGVSIAAMEKALQSLGFASAAETAIGATYVKREYDAIVNEGKQRVVISSCCHSVNLLIEKYYPQALPWLARVLSPMQAHCAVIKKQDPQVKTVFIGPCISKKAEADILTNVVDCVLTFDELSEWMDKKGITFEQVEDDNKEEGRARLFPTCGGILKTMECANSDYTYLSIDGMENCISALEDISEGLLTDCFIEMSACTGSCIGGPIMSRDKSAPIRNVVAISQYAREKDFSHVIPEGLSLKKNYSYKGVVKTRPGAKELENILRKMGKNSPEDELNCGNCGYNTCRDKAVAVYQGKANFAMCLPFLKEKAESFSDNIINNTLNGIIVLNEAFEVQQVNKAALRMMNIKDQSFVMGEPVVRVLDPTPFIEVLETKRNIYEQKRYLAEYQKYVEQTIIFDKSYHILICIMRDVTTDETDRKKKSALSHQTIETANQVVEKQMRVVQEIASLLGETTAETKIAMTRLKESFADE